MLIAVAEGVAIDKSKYHPRTFLCQLPCLNTICQPTRSTTCGSPTPTIPCAFLTHFCPHGTCITITNVLAIYDYMHPYCYFMYFYVIDVPGMHYRYWLTYNWAR